jgi:transcriptional regulator of acetoin/glycerol metabolism
VLATVSLFDDSSTLIRPPDDLSLFRGAHPHALLIGSAASAKAALGRLLPHLRAPLSHWQTQSAGQPPQETTGTLVIWDVDALARTRQEQLLAWMESRAPELQVISISERPVFPLVSSDDFLDTLYYRLNTVCLDPCSV